MSAYSKPKNMSAVPAKKDEPRRMRADEVTQPTKAGWMLKNGGPFHSWRKRFFVLKNKHLFWWNNMQTDQYKYINLSEFMVEIGDTLGTNAKHNKALAGVKTKNLHIVLFLPLDATKRKSYIFALEDDKSLEQWFSAILVERYKPKTDKLDNDLADNISALSSLARSRNEAAAEPDPPKEPTELTTQAALDARMKELYVNLSADTATVIFDMPAGSKPLPRDDGDKPRFTAAINTLGSGPANAPASSSAAAAAASPGPAASNLPPLSPRSAMEPSIPEETPELKTAVTRFLDTTNARTRAAQQQKGVRGTCAKCGVGVEQHPSMVRPDGGHQRTGSATFTADAFQMDGTLYCRDCGPQMYLKKVGYNVGQK